VLELVVAGIRFCHDKCQRREWLPLHFVRFAVRLHTPISILLLACMSAAAAPRNVVLIVTDDQGLIAGCYGNAVIKTPNIDALAADGTRFENAFCTTSSCSPSRSVILTGQFNHANGQYGLEHGYNHFNSFNNVKSLPMVLGEAGYRTARVGKYHVGPASVYHFEEVLGGNSHNPVDMAEKSRTLIEARSNRPFFLYFCPNDPHRGAVATWSKLKANSFGNLRPDQTPEGVEPVHYKPEEVIVPPFLPDTPTCRAELAQYYESISRIDSGVGRLIDILKKAGKYDETLIIYISDNGVPFPGAKTTVYEAGLRLPCIVRNPAAKKRGVVSEAFVSWVDITPTILDFAGLKAADNKKLQPHGRSFLSILDQKKPDGWDEVYASHTFHEVTMYYPMRVVRSGRYKLIWNIASPLPFPFASDLYGSATWQDSSKRGDDFMYGKRTIKAYTHRPEFELYDLAKDPDEIYNLVGDPSHKETLASLKEKLKQFQKRTDDPWILKWQHE
jgi:N-sulfoglucosamine sulfohydrolase